MWILFLSKVFTWLLKTITLADTGTASEVLVVLVLAGATLLETFLSPRISPAVSAQVVNTSFSLMGPVGGGLPSSLLKFSFQMWVTTYGIFDSGQASFAQTANVSLAGNGMMLARSRPKQSGGKKNR